MLDNRRRALMTRSLAVVAAALGLVAATVAGPASAAAPGRYVALGDSYAAGQGAGDYSDGDCLRSPNSYPQQLAPAVEPAKVMNRACSGATTTDVLRSQIVSVRSTTTLVTVTVGANDVRAYEVAGTCLLSPDDCAGAIQGAIAALPAAQAGVAAICHEAQSRAPGARIIFTGYPALFDAATPNLVLAGINTALVTLDSALGSAAVGAGCQYLDVTGLFQGHTPDVDPAGSWLNLNLADPMNLDNLHPNTAGYAAYAQAIGAAPEE
jgi:lysophospholipase L1-like esterase